MRVAEVREHARGLGSHDHVCWVFDHAGEFAVRAAEYLEDGLAGGDRIILFTREPAAAKEILGRLRGIDSASAPGAASAAVLSQMYGESAVVEPDAQVAAYAVATAQAVTDGFRGLRIAADATALVRTGPQRDAFARYEYLVDRLMAAEPFSALCAYDRTELGDEAVAEIACVHPNVSPGATQFRVYATRNGTGLAGELDASTRELFTRTLHRSIPAPTADLVVDASRLEFVDHGSLQAIDDFASQHGVVAELHHATPLAAQLADLLQLKHIRMVPNR